MAEQFNHLLKVTMQYFAHYIMHYPSLYKYFLSTLYNFIINSNQLLYYFSIILHAKKQLTEYNI